MLKYTLTLYILIKRINFEQKLLFKNMAFLVSLPDRLYIYLNISPYYQMVNMFLFILSLIRRLKERFLVQNYNFFPNFWDKICICFLAMSLKLCTSIQIGKQHLG